MCVQAETRPDSASAATQPRIRTHLGLAATQTGILEPGTQDPAVQPSNLTCQDRVEAPHARGWHRGGFRARRRTAGAGASQRPNGDRFGRCGAPEPEQRSTTRASPCPGRPRCHKHNPLHGDRDRLPPQPPIDAFHNFLHRHGEPGRVALAATVRKLLPILNAVIRDRVSLTAKPRTPRLPQD